MLDIVSRQRCWFSCVSTSLREKSEASLCEIREIRKVFNSPCVRTGPLPTWIELQTYELSSQADISAFSRKSKGLMSTKRASFPL
jgi:hypothetical protein